MMNWEPLFFRIFRLDKPKRKADERTRTADLLITNGNKALQGFAQDCEPRIPKPVSFLCLALCYVLVGVQGALGDVQEGACSCPQDAAFYEEFVLPFEHVERLVLES